MARPSVGEEFKFIVVDQDDEAIPFQRHVLQEREEEKQENPTNAEYRKHLISNSLPWEKGNKLWRNGEPEKTSTRLELSPTRPNPSSNFSWRDISSQSKMMSLHESLIQQQKQQPPQQPPQQQPLLSSSSSSSSSTSTRQQHLTIREPHVNMIEKFTPELIRPNHRNLFNQGGSTIVISGKPGSGKSTLISGLIHSKRDIIPVAVAVNESEESNHFYKSLFPQAFVYNQYDVEILDRVFERQKKLCSKMKIQKENHINPWMLLILDDCTTDPHIFKTKQQSELFKNGRHLFILYILSFQYICDLPRSLRSSVSGGFFFKETSVNVLKSLYDNFAGVIPSFRLFRQLMSNITGNYRCLFIDNMSQSNEWLSCVYYCQTPYRFADQLGTNDTDGSQNSKKGLGAFGSQNYRSFRKNTPVILPSSDTLKMENWLNVRNHPNSDRKTKTAKKFVTN